MRTKCIKRSCARRTLHFASRMLRHGAQPLALWLAPVHAALPGEHAIADELAAQRGRIPVVPLDGFVHLRLAIAPIRLEFFRQPAQYDPALLAAGRDGLERFP